MSILETFAGRTRDNVFFGNVTAARFTANPQVDSPAANVTANNPVLNPPSVTGLRFFGQSRIARMAMDQILPKPIGQFPSNVHGSALTSFRFAKDPLFAGNNPMAYAFGVLSLGSQFVSIPGVSTLISGGMQSVLAKTVKSLIEGLLPSSIPAFPFKTEILSLLDDVSMFGKDLVDTLNSLVNGAAASMLFGPNASFIPTLFQIGDMITSTILGKSIKEISNMVSPLISSLSGYQPGIVSPGLSGIINENPSNYLNGIIDQQIASVVPGSPPVIRSLFNSTNNLSNIIETNVYQSVNLADNTDAAVALIGKASAVFAGSTQQTVSNDEIARGNDASKEVLEIYRKIKNDLFDNKIPNVWDQNPQQDRVFAKSYSLDGIINIQNSRKI